MKMYQLHQIPTVEQCLDYKALKMVNNPTHETGTQTANTMKTDVTDCYYSDCDFILCSITV